MLLLDSIPIVAITGQVTREAMGTDAFQEIDILGLSLACTKHSFLVTEPDQLLPTLQEAFELANSGRPGPVLVDIPKDIQMTPMDYHPPLEVIHSQAPRTPTNETADIRRAMNLLQQARKPVAYIGGGCGYGRCRRYI